MKTIEEIEIGYAHYRTISQIKPMPQAVRSFFSFCKKHSHDGFIHQEQIDLWAKKREKETLNTNYTRVIHVKQMLDFAYSRGWTDVKMEKNVRWHARSKKMIFLTTDEIDNFFKACDENINNAYLIRNKAIRINPFTAKVLFLLLYSAGLRPLEARMLSRTDVDLDTGIIYIHVTKGYREHITVLGDEMLSVMKQYDNTMESIVPNRKAFFSDSKGDYHSKGWVSNTFRKLWHKYNERNAVAYNFRHNYAIENINSWNGVSPEAICDKLLALSRSMGHSKLAHTLYYYSLSPLYSKDMRKLSSQNINQIIHDIPDEIEY